ncbi:MAG TPA: type II toxin-antitoxin system VapC family toxin [Leptolinea sp.]
MSSPIICIDPGPVIQLTTFPRNNAIRTLWDRWEKEQRRILAPSLLFYDVSNILSTYIRQGMLSHRTVQAIMQACRALPIHLVDDPDLQVRALQLSEKYILPLGCDPHYLALAVRLDKELWTYDRRLAVAVNQTGAVPRVRWIGRKQDLASV